ncbi:MAG: hypothetical protein ACRCXZ_08535 [Patescibacteria group bacterium]
MVTIPKRISRPQAGDFDFIYKFFQNPPKEFMCAEEASVFILAVCRSQPNLAYGLMITKSLIPEFGIKNCSETIYRIALESLYKEGLIEFQRIKCIGRGRPRNLIKISKDKEKDVNNLLSEAMPSVFNTNSTQFFSI